MNEKTLSDVTLTSGKAVYEKPTSQVYEMEVEGAILSGSDLESNSIPDMEYETPWE